MFVLLCSVMLIVLFELLSNRIDQDPCFAGDYFCCCDKRMNDIFVWKAIVLTWQTFSLTILQYMYCLFSRCKNNKVYVVWQAQKK